MKHAHISPRVIERINIARRESLPPPRHTHRSHAAKAATMGLMYGGKLCLTRPAKQGSLFPH